MKIESVQAIPLEIPLKKVFSGSFYPVTGRSTIVTRTRTAGGLQSAVYNGDNRAHRREIARIVEDELAALLIGEEDTLIRLASLATLSRGAGEGERVNARPGRRGPRS